MAPACLKRLFLGQFLHTFPWCFVYLIWIPPLLSFDPCLQSAVCSRYLLHPANCASVSHILICPQTTSPACLSNPLASYTGKKSHQADPRLCRFLVGHCLDPATTTPLTLTPCERELFVTSHRWRQPYRSRDPVRSQKTEEIGTSAGHTVGMELLKDQTIQGDKHCLVDNQDVGQAPPESACRILWHPNIINFLCNYLGRLFS